MKTVGTGSGGGTTNNINAAGIPQVIDTSSTTDTDHGNGKISYNNATQASATVIRMDDLDSDGTSIAALLGSAVGNIIYIVSSATPTKYQTWYCSAWAAPAGYTNLTVSLIAKSAADFANTEAVKILFLASVTLGAGSPNNSQGINGQFYLRSDPPFMGALYKKAAGVWTVQNQNYVAASVPDPTTCSGSVITITDVGVNGSEWASNGTIWKPISPYVHSAFLGTTASPVQSISNIAATTQLFTSALTTFPAILGGFFHAGSILEFHYGFRRVGAVDAGAIGMGLKFGPNNGTSDTTLVSLNMTQTANQDERNMGLIYITSGSIAQGSNGLGICTLTATQFNGAVTGALTLTAAQYLQPWMNGATGTDQVALIYSIVKVLA